MCSVALAKVVLNKPTRFNGTPACAAARGAWAVARGRAISDKLYYPLAAKV